MKFSIAVRCVLCLVAASALSACKSRSVAASDGASASQSSSASAADISPGAPTFNEQFQTRNPRACGKVTHVPSAAEAAVLAQCEQEAASNTGGSSPMLMLVTDVAVELGSPKAYTPGVDDYADNVDTAALVYPLRGSSTAYTCTPVNDYNRGKNCGKSYGGQVGQGACWHNQFNEWRCRMTMGGKNQELQVPGPTTF